MNKNALSLISAGLLLSCTGLAHAEDQAANISVSGLVTPGYSCFVNMSQSSVSIVETPDKLIKQGNNATNPVIIHLSVKSNTVNHQQQCDSLLAEGKLVYRISGTADNADGTVLANQLKDSTAASGLGIGLFDASNTPINVNTGRLAATADTILGLQLVQLSNQEAVSGNINALASIDVEHL